MRSVPLAFLIWANVSFTAALAQVPGLPDPYLQNRIPAPLPPPVVNGPLGQSPPPGVYLPPHLNTYSDRVSACVHAGSSYGLRGKKLDRYARACANAN